MILASFPPHTIRVSPPGISLRDRFGSSRVFQNKAQRIGFIRKSKHVSFAKIDHTNQFTVTFISQIQKTIVPVVASVAVLLWSHPAEAGFLSGSTGIESVPGPELPKIEFLNRFNEENQKRYADLDARFKESPLLKKLLEKSEQNREKNKQAILDKYCIRGAEWGVGDCSAEGMTPDEKDKFIAALKLKAGITD